MTSAIAELEELRSQLKEVTVERNSLHAQLTDVRLKMLEIKLEDHETRMRTQEQIGTKVNYLLFGNGILSLFAIYKIFMP